MLVLQVSAAPLMEEGFNYPVGSGLAGNPPWAGSSGSSASIVSGNLTLANLRGTVPTGNMLQITGGTNRTVYRNFSSNSVTAGTVYCSALIRCLKPPTNSQFIASLMPAGSTAHNRDTDPLDLNVTTASNGFTFSMSSAGGDSATARQGLTTNSVHFIVMKYIFGSVGQVSLYVDPAPGGAEPSSPTISPESGDSGTGAANLQVLMLQASSSTGQGSFNLDTVRVGTNWADVTQTNIPLSLNGPQSQAVCFGSSASFKVLASGTPPISYQWRTNGTSVANATNSAFTLIYPTASDTKNNFDVIVTDAFGSITGQVANLTLSTNAAAILFPPANQLVSVGAASVTFNVAVAGDPPLSLQWRTNGIAIPGATNTSYVILNPGPADAANAIDFVVANPCGASTSSPPVNVVFPNQFYSAYDAGPGFFSGEDLILTNSSATSIYVWSSPDLSIPVTNWTFEGGMSEQVFNDNNGMSLYSINVNPITSPVYYVFAKTINGPYTGREPILTVTTSDYQSFAVTRLTVPMSSAGLLDQIIFYAAYDAGPGFFSGEDLVLTNTSGTDINVWSSLDLTVPVTAWNYEGLMSEQIFNNNNGTSLYSINVNPISSPVYYIFAETNVGIYNANEPLVWLTTSDYVDFVVTEVDAAISTNGIFSFATLPTITLSPQSQTVLSGQNTILNVSASGDSLGYQWFFNNIGLGVPSNPMLGLTNVSFTNAGGYFVVVTNAWGSATSSLALLSVTSAPAVALAATAGGGVQLSASSVTGLTFVVQSATNLFHPIWQSILTNNTGNSGVIQFLTNISSKPFQYYRLVFP